MNRQKKLENEVNYLKIERLSVHPVILYISF